MSSEPQQLDSSPATACGESCGCAGKSRRSFMAWASVALGAVASAAVGVPVVGYLLSAVWKPAKNEWIDLGAIEAFPIGETRAAHFKLPNLPAWDGAAADTLAYVRRVAANHFQVFAVNCAHLGCPVSWFPQSGLFLCPCHGGVYYADGSRASGPPPRGLFEYPWEVRPDNHLWIFAGHMPSLADPLDQAAPPKEPVARVRAQKESPRS